MKSKILIWIAFMLLIGIMSVGSVGDEVSQLENELEDAGYGWLVDYLIEYPRVEEITEEIQLKKMRIDEIREEMKGGNI